jgi:DNA-binding NtrC family response regulator
MPEGAAGADERSELEALKLLILAMWRELSALEAAGAAQREGAAVDLPLEMRRFESDLIRCALIRTGGRQRRAARLLGMSVATLNAKIKRYRIDADEILNHAAALRLRTKGVTRDVEQQRIPVEHP